MHVVVQCVSEARVEVGGSVVGQIGRGLLILAGMEAGDSEAEVAVCADKLANMRCFEGLTPTDRSLIDIKGAALVVSQFTLCANHKKGKRPSFTRALDPRQAEPLYEFLTDKLRELGIEVATGRFGAEMMVSLTNTGPMTFILRIRDGRVLGPDE